MLSAAQFQFMQSFAFCLDSTKQQSIINSQKNQKTSLPQMKFQHYQKYHQKIQNQSQKTKALNLSDKTLKRYQEDKQKSQKVKKQIIQTERVVNLQDNQAIKDTINKSLEKALIKIGIQKSQFKLGIMNSIQQKQNQVRIQKGQNKKCNQLVEFLYKILFQKWIKYFITTQQNQTSFQHLGSIELAFILNLYQNKFNQ